MDYVPPAPPKPEPPKPVEPEPTPKTEPEPVEPPEENIEEKPKVIDTTTIIDKSKLPEPVDNNENQEPKLPPPKQI